MLRGFPKGPLDQLWQIGKIGYTRADDSVQLCRDNRALLCCSQMGRKGTPGDVHLVCDCLEHPKFGKPGPDVVQYMLEWIPNIPNYLAT